jgi:hypothetical protein
MSGKLKFSSTGSAGLRDDTSMIGVSVSQSVALRHS